MGLLLGTCVPLVTVLLVPDVGHFGRSLRDWCCRRRGDQFDRMFDQLQTRFACLGTLANVAAGTVDDRIWLTIGYEKPHALVFAGSIMVIGLLARYIARNYQDIGRWLVHPFPRCFRFQVPKELRRHLGSRTAVLISYQQ